jgi:twitching motility two-component system response regulator PilG
LIGKAEEEQAMGPRVLIIDKSQLSCIILQTALRRAGIESVAYADGREIFTALAEEPGLDPDVVLLEAELPFIDGYSLVQQLKGETRLSHCTFIMLSRRDGLLDRIKGRLAGAADYMTKPLDTKQVVAVVEGYLTPGPPQEAGAQQRPGR